MIEVRPAKALDDSLAMGLDGLSRRFYARTRQIVDIPWAIATGEDLRFPQVDGQRPPVLNLLAPPSSLMSPRVAWRVLARSAPKGEGSPERQHE